MSSRISSCCCSCRASVPPRTCGATLRRSTLWSHSCCCSWRPRCRCTSHVASRRMAGEDSSSAERKLRADGARERSREPARGSRRVALPALERFSQAFVESDRQILAARAKYGGDGQYAAANAVYWFDHELRQYPAVELDLDALHT